MCTSKPDVPDPVAPPAPPEEKKIKLNTSKITSAKKKKAGTSKLQIPLTGGSGSGLYIPGGN